MLVVHHAVMADGHPMLVRRGASPRNHQPCPHFNLVHNMLVLQVDRHAGAPEATVGPHLLACAQTMQMI